MEANMLINNGSFHINGELISKGKDWWTQMQILWITALNSTHFSFS